MSDIIVSQHSIYCGVRSDDPRGCTCKADAPAVLAAERRCPHCGLLGIEHTPEDIARFEADMAAMRRRNIRARIRSVQ